MCRETENAERKVSQQCVHVKSDLNCELFLRPEHAFTFTSLLLFYQKQHQNNLSVKQL